MINVEAALRAVDPEVASVARVYNWYLGGSHHFPADVEFAERAELQLPDVRLMANLNRTFLMTAVLALAEMGIDQFLDLGAGIPDPGTGPTDVIARRVIPDTRVVYVDNDPVTVAYGQHRFAGDPTTVMIDGDVTDPEFVVGHPDLRAVLDLSRPVGVIMGAILHLMPEGERPYNIVAQYRDATVPGSALVVSQGTVDGCPAMVKMVDHYASVGVTYVTRGLPEMRRFLDGYSILPPGIVLTGRWRCDRVLDPEVLDSSGAYAAVGIRR